jgi:hypothetical protein
MDSLVEEFQQALNGRDPDVARRLASQLIAVGLEITIDVQPEPPRHLPYVYNVPPSHEPFSPATPPQPYMPSQYLQYSSHHVAPSMTQVMPSQSYPSYLPPPSSQGYPLTRLALKQQLVSLGYPPAQAHRAAENCSSVQEALSYLAN